MEAWCIPRLWMKEIASRYGGQLSIYSSLGELGAGLTAPHTD